MDVVVRVLFANPGCNVLQSVLEMVERIYRSFHKLIEIVDHYGFPLSRVMYPEYTPCPSVYRWRREAIVNRGDDNVTKGRYRK